MLFSDRPRTHYEKPLAHEVICQLRFPTILTINNTEPADFQEAVREDFPQYARRQDQLPPRVVNGKPEPQAPVTNYHFLSQDGRWKLNLTRDFIALSTLSYPGWEEFARMLDKPLASFIQLYKAPPISSGWVCGISISFPGTRWGWRIRRGVSCSPRRIWVFWRSWMWTRSASPWRVLMYSSSWIPAAPPRFTPVPPILKTTHPTRRRTPEVKFILDMDLSMSGNTPCGLAAPALETLHGHSTRIFEGAVTDTLRQAMGRV